MALWPLETAWLVWQLLGRGRAIESLGGAGGPCPVCGLQWDAHPIVSWHDDAWMQGRPSVLRRPCGQDDGGIFFPMPESFLVTLDPATVARLRQEIQAEAARSRRLEAGLDKLDPGAPAEIIGGLRGY